jgi:ELWxxDGT repeat protein
VVLFNGFDAAGKQGLWVTDGTTAGTHEIAVNGAAPGGLNPSDLTAFNHHEVLFNGVDAAGKHSLWETDGTTAGTHEITGINRPHGLQSP